MCKKKYVNVDAHLKYKLNAANELHYLFIHCLLGLVGSDVYWVFSEHISSDLIFYCSRWRRPACPNICLSLKLCSGNNHSKLTAGQIDLKFQFLYFI